MKKDKEIKLYEEPVVKVVKFTIECGFQISPGGGEGGGQGGGETGGDDEVEDAPYFGNSYFKIDDRRF